MFLLSRVDKPFILNVMIKNAHNYLIEYAFPFYNSGNAQFTKIDAE